MKRFRELFLLAVLTMHVASVIAATPAQSAHRNKRFSSQTVIAKYTDRLYQPDHCGTRCRNNPNCVAWSYEGPPRGAPIGTTSVCYILSGVTPPLIDDRRLTSAFAEEALTGDIDNQCIKPLTVAIAGYETTTLSRPNPGLCAEKCRTTLGCRAWTYHKLITGRSPWPLSCFLTPENPPTFLSSTAFLPSTGCLSGTR